MLKVVLFLAACLCAYQSASTTASLIKDSLKIRAFVGQATPFSDLEEAGALFLSHPTSVPVPCRYSLLSAPASRDLVFNIFFLDSGRSIASVEYVYYPLGSFRDTSYPLTFKDTVFSGFIDSASVPLGAFGQVRIIDDDNNFYAIPLGHYPRVPYTWNFKPNRWYAVKPPRGSTRLLTALVNRPDLYSQMGEKHLFCYYKNGAFYDYTETDHLSGLRLSEAFLLYLTEPFTCQDTLESVFLDSAYNNPVDHLLLAGWNLIVNPYPYPVSIRNVRAVKNISAFFSLSDSSNDKTTYYHVHSPAADSNGVLEPFYGYWVHSSDSNRLTFHPYIAAYPGLGKQAGGDSWVLKVRNARSSILLGMADRAEKLTLPPGGEGRALSSDNGLAVNFAASGERGFMARINPEQGIAHSFDLSGCREEKSVLYIADEKRAVPVSSGSSYALPASDYCGLFFMSGPEDFVASKIHEVNALFPEAFTVSGNYPNPFNPVTFIRYGVPFHLKGRRVDFSVYDISGRLIHTRSFSASPGFHTLSWDSRDERGKALSSGCYVGTLRVRDNTRTIRMVVVK